MNDWTPRVVIFGAGVTGLTVAHELVERGWDVTVVEKEIDPLDADECAIGGLAKTQWSVYQPPGLSPDVALDDAPTELVPLVPTVRLRLRTDVVPLEVEAAPGPTGTPDQRVVAPKKKARTGKQAPKRKATAAKARETTKDFLAKLEAKAPAGTVGRDAALRRLGLRQSVFMRYFRRLLDDGSAIYLDRVADRLRAIWPFVPKLTITWGLQAPGFIAPWLRVYLLCVVDGAAGAVVNTTPGGTFTERSARDGAADPTPVIACGTAPDRGIPGRAWQIETDLSDALPSAEPQGPVTPGDFAGVLPGEHGFRFFPALYRHLFDTLKRIPVRAAGQSFGDTYRTVFDNLVPTESNWLFVDDRALRPQSTTAKRGDVVRFPRRLRKSMREVFDALNDMQTELGYTARDIQLLSLRLFKYMTSCRRRRNEQYEIMSWADFMGLSDLSPVAKQDMVRAPQLLAAMTAEESDARTQGNLATQLMLDPVNADDRVDSTLNAPTTVAWFAPWKDYLLSQGVTFVPGKLVGFEPDGDPPQIRSIRPVVKANPPLDPTYDLFQRANYYVLAIPVQAWSEEPALFQQWESARKAVGVDKKDHVSRLRDWLASHVKREEKGLYKGLTGVQFYFDSDELTRSGHTLCMDSPWRLCAISQASFWNRRREAFDCYRGIVSVDVGTVEEPAKPLPGDPPAFWATPRSEVHTTVWRQIDPIYAADQKPINLPFRMYRIDEYIRYDSATGTPLANLAPFLINGVDEWDDRAGWDTPHKDRDPREEPQTHPAEEPSEARYQLMPRYTDENAIIGAAKWVLAGTFMQTWTRATTMESANESARHAVNTLLADWKGERLGQVELCRIWDPERYEHPDLRIWRELDAKLFEYGGGEPLPHMFDILELDAIPDALLEKGDLSKIVEDLASTLARKATNE